MNKIYLFLFAYLLVNSPFFAQEFDFKVLSVKDGLSQSSVTCMAQDNNGFVWIGTRDGLNYYDGQDIKVFRKIPFDTTSLNSNSIECLLADNSLGIWVGTANGLNWYDAQSQTFDKITLREGKIHVVPKTIFQDNLGEVWIGTANGFYSVKRDSERKQFLTKSYLFNENPKDQNILSYRITAFLHDSQNNFWVITSKGLFRFPFSEIQNLDLTFNSTSFLENYLVSSEGFNSIYEHSDGTIFCSNREKIWRFDDKNDKFIDFFEIDEKEKTSISHIQKTQNGQLLVVTKSGLYFLSIEENVISSFYFLNSPELGISLNRHKINFAFEDKIYEGLYWLATDIGGVMKLFRSKKPFTTVFLQNVPNLKIINPYLQHIIVENKRVWVSLGSGILIYDRVHEKFQYIQDILPKDRTPRTSSVYCLFQNQKGRILIGTVGAIVEMWFDEKDNIQSRYHPFQELCIHRTNAIVETSEHLIIGSGGGTISVLQKDNFKEIYCIDPINFLELPAQVNITSLLMDKESNLWVGTSNGLIVYQNFNPEEKPSTEPQYFSYNPSDTTSLVENRITHLMQDSKDNVWICTRNGLMTANISEQSIQLKQVKVEELRNQVIYAILEDMETGQFWMSTNSGLFCYDPNSGKVDNFTVKDGLQGNEFNTNSFFQSKEEGMYFGGPKGVSHFYSKDIHRNTEAPPVYFTELSTDDSEQINLFTFDKKETLMLDYNQRSFTIGFIALDFFQPDELEYFYELEGSSSIEKGNLGNLSQIHFSQLRPDNYILHIRAANNDGYFLPEGDTINFTILAPFWKMMWFYLLMTGVVIALFWLAFYLRYRNNMNKLAAIEQIRKSISEDFHDELGSKLSIISMYSEFTKNELEDTNSKAALYLDKVNNTAARLYESTRDLIWALNPQNDTLYDIYLQMKDFGEELFQDTDINFHAVGIADNLKGKNLPMSYKRHLLLIFKEAMHNALKHAACNNIRLSIEQEEQKLIFGLQDDGKGFDTSTIYKGDGLKNIQNRAKQINGKLHFISKNKGTWIRLEIPK